MESPEQRAEAVAPELRQRIVPWVRTHGRSYPWRQTRDADCILIAEVLLHRTRADQVMPVYQALTMRFPTIASLATADVGEIHALLRPLGLRWRVDLLLEMARALVQDAGGRIPDDRARLEELPGVGPYIAAAVMCFGFGHAEPILDTNTVRILSRVFSLPLSDGSRRSRLYRRVMERLVDPDHPREFNFGLLDLGALICTPRSPNCSSCPLQPCCDSGHDRTTEIDSTRT